MLLNSAPICCLEYLHPSLLLLGHTIAPLRVCAGRSKHVSSAASGRCSRISPSRGLVEGLVCVCSSEPCPSATPRATHSFFLNVVPTCFDTAVASPRLLPAPSFVEGSLPRDCLAHFAVHRECPAHFAVSPAVGDVPVRCAEQPTASPRTGPSVPWVSCRDPLG